MHLPVISILMTRNSKTAAREFSVFPKVSELANYVLGLIL